ncbi:MAG: NUDIX domain-containing protein [Candidatus Saccharibacteria bacterium]
MRTAVRAIIIKDNNLLVMDRNKFGHRYVALIGGGVEVNEGLEAALVREVREETSIEITNLRLVIEEDAGNVYGLQYIYLCDWVSGEPKLESDSIEAKITADGKNIYTPKWLPLSELPNTKLLPSELKELLLKFIDSGFPDKPTKLSIARDSEL